MSFKTLLTTGSATALALAISFVTPVEDASAETAAEQQQERGDWRQSRGERRDARPNRGQQIEDRQARPERPQFRQQAPAPATPQAAPVRNRPVAEPPANIREAQRRAQNQNDRRDDWRTDRREDRRTDRREDGRTDRGTETRVDRRDDRRVEDRVERRVEQRVDRREDRREDWRTNRDSYRDGRRDERRTDRRDDRRDTRDANRNGYRDANRAQDNRRYDNQRRWDRREWRSNHRYNWYNHRHQNRNIFRLGRYYAPYRGYSYRRFSIGFTISSGFYGSRYWINDPWSYRLPDVYGPYRWVRYYDDVLLVNIYSGEVVDVIHNFFW